MHFHLVPAGRMPCVPLAWKSYTAACWGLAKWITSITMTVFYVLLYYVWRKRYQVTGRSGPSDSRCLWPGRRADLFCA